MDLFHPRFSTHKAFHTQIPSYLIYSILTCRTLNWFVMRKYWFFHSHLRSDVPFVVNEFVAVRNLLYLASVFISLAFISLMSDWRPWERLYFFSFRKIAVQWEKFFDVSAIVLWTGLHSFFLVSEHIILKLIKWIVYLYQKFQANSNPLFEFIAISSFVLSIPSSW